jgi:hypothetical protein
MRSQTSILVGKLRKSGAFEVIEMSDKANKLQKSFDKADPEKYSLVGIIRNPVMQRRRRLFTKEQLSAQQRANEEATKAAKMKDVTAAEQTALDLEHQAKNARAEADRLKHRHGLNKKDLKKAEKTAEENLPPAPPSSTTPPTPPTEPTPPVPTTPPTEPVAPPKPEETPVAPVTAPTSEPSEPVTSAPAAPAASGTTSAAKAAGKKAAAKKKAKAAAKAAATK